MLVSYVPLAKEELVEVPTSPRWLAVSSELCFRYDSVYARPRRRRDPRDRPRRDCDRDRPLRRIPRDHRRRPRDARVWARPRQVELERQNSMQRDLRRRRRRASRNAHYSSYFYDHYASAETQQLRRSDSNLSRRSEFSTTPGLGFSSGAHWARASY